MDGRDRVVMPRRSLTGWNELRDSRHRSPGIASKSSGFMRECRQFSACTATGMCYSTQEVRDDRVWPNATCPSRKPDIRRWNPQWIAPRPEQVLRATRPKPEKGPDALFQETLAFKPNRPRTLGNIINRVFDSSGPEGKVRGTPQQIIEKYQMLARDAQLSNDRVAAENFLQHAEHYTRMLAEAQREMAAEQEQRRPQGEYGQNGNQNGGQGGNQGGGQGQGHYQGGNQQGGNQPNPNRDQGRDANRDRPYRDERPDPRDEQPDVAPVVRSTGMMDFIEDLGESSLVETPETRARQDAGRSDFTERRDRGPRTEQAERQPRPEGNEGPNTAAKTASRARPRSQRRPMLPKRSLRRKLPRRSRPKPPAARARRASRAAKARHPTAAARQKPPSDRVPSAQLRAPGRRTSQARFLPHER